MKQFFNNLLDKIINWAYKRRSVDLAAMSTLFITALFFITVAINSDILYFVWLIVILVLVYKLTYNAFEVFKSMEKYKRNKK